MHKQIFVHMGEWAQVCAELLCNHSESSVAHTFIPTNTKTALPICFSLNWCLHTPWINKAWLQYKHTHAVINYKLWFMELFRSGDTNMVSVNEPLLH